MSAQKPKGVDKKLLVVLILAAVAFVILLPRNLRLIEKARRDTQEAEALARQTSDKRVASPTHADLTAQLEQAQRRIAANPKDPDAYLAYGESLYANGRPLDGSIALKTAASLAPNRPEPHAQLARIYLDLDYTDLGIEELQKQIKLAPNDTTPVLLLAFTFGRLGHYLEALEVLSQAQKHNSHAPELYVATAVARMSSADETGALEAAETAYKMAPEDTRVVNTLALAYEQRNRSAEAIPLLQKAVEKNPANSANRIVLARLIMNQPTKREEGRRMLEETIARDPGNLEARYILAQSLIKSRAEAKAIPYLEYIRQRQPGFRSTLLLLGQTYLNTGHTSEGKALLAEHKRREAEDQTLSELMVKVGMHPGDHSSRFRLAEAYIRRGKYGHALYELKILRGAQPRLDRVKPLMVEAYMMSGRVGEAEELTSGRKMAGMHLTYAGSADAGRALARALLRIRQQVTRSPKDAEAWLRLGAVLARAGDVEQSIAALERAATLAPNKALTWRSLAQMNRIAGHRAEELAALNHWRALEPNDPEMNQTLGEALIGVGWVRDALPVAKHAVELSPNSSEAHKMLASVYYYQGAMDNSIAELKRAHELAPGDNDIDMNLALIHFGTGHYRDAMTLLNTYLAHVPNDPQALQMRGRCNERDPAGDLSAAERDFRHVIDLQPTNHEAHCFLGIVYRRQRRWTEAISEMETALRLRPDYVTAMKPLATLYTQRGKRAEGARLIARSRELEAIAEELNRAQLKMTMYPNDPMVHLAVGRAFRKMNRDEDAVAEFRHGLDLAPDNAELKTALQEALKVRRNSVHRPG